MKFRAKQEKSIRKFLQKMTFLSKEIWQCPKAHAAFFLNTLEQICGIYMYVHATNTILNLHNTRVKIGIHNSQSQYANKLRDTDKKDSNRTIIFNNLEKMC